VNTSKSDRVPGLRLEGVFRSVEGELHLAGIDLTLEPGSFNVLLGRTRAGKTSLLRVMAGLDKPDRGRVFAGSEDVTHRHVRERQVAMVYQQFINYPSLTVYENIASPLRLRHDLARKELDRRVNEVAELLGLKPYLRRLPGDLSGGQQQRTAIARALVKDSKLVLLDEPLANLDYKLREELRVQLRALFAARGATVVYATAEPDEALLLGGQTAILDEGRLLQFGPALELYRRPNSERVAQVFSDPQLNLLELQVEAEGRGRVGDAEAVPLSAPLRELAPGRYRLGVRADHLRLAAESATDLRLRTSTLVDEVTGSATLLHVAFGSSTLTAQLPGIHRRALGSEVELFIAPRRVFVFHLDGSLVAH
jgi:glycerol transport system ATP-binding protein